MLQDQSEVGRPLRGRPGETEAESRLAATGMVGKWHIGAEEGYRPTERGFDEFYGFFPFGIAAQNGQVPIYRGTKEVETPQNHMESFSAEALAFIDRHAREPFLLYLPFSAVHGPYVGPQPWRAKFDTLVPANRRAYAADISQMDDIIGRVMARLRERGLEEDTLIFYVWANPCAHRNKSHFGHHESPGANHHQAGSSER